MNTEISLLAGSVGILIGLLFIILIAYYIQFFCEINYHVSTKKEFWLALIPFQLWISDLIQVYKDLD